MKVLPKESCNQGYYSFTIEDNQFVEFEGYCFRSSYNVLFARLLGLSYPDFLRFCRAAGGILMGKQGYAYVNFKNKMDCQKICNLINKEIKKLEKSIVSSTL